MSLVNLFITSLLTQNIVLSKFLGICPFMGTSNKEKNALQMGISVLIIVMLSSVLTYGIYHFLLVPTSTTYLKTVVFILVIACMVQLLEILLRKYFPVIHKSLGLYLPLITTNCAVLGIMLLNINNSFTFVETLIFSFGSSLGFTFVIYLFSTIRERIEECNVPKSFRGFPIALITASIMALLFTRYLPL